MGDAPGRRPGPADEPGDAQAHLRHLAIAVHGDLHQPDPHEDRRDVRLARNHVGRQRAQVLRLRAPRHPPDRRDQGPRRGRRQHHPRQGRQEQGRAALQAGRVRHHVRRRHLETRRIDRPRRQGRGRREIRVAGIPSPTSESAKAARTPRPTSRRTPTSPSRSRTNCGPRMASNSTSPARTIRPSFSTTDEDLHRFVKRLRSSPEPFCVRALMAEPSVTRET